MAKKGNEIAELERQLEALNGEVAAALAEADALQNRRQSVLISGTDDDLANHDAAFAAAQRKRERAVARLTDVESRLAQERSNKADADRAAARKEAEAAGAATADALRKAYADITKMIASLKDRVADAGAKIGGVNRTKGDGEDEIASVAARVFANRIQPREVLSDEIVELWVFEATGAILSDQTGIQTKGEGRGIFYSDSIQGRRPHPVLLKKFRRRQFLAERRYEMPSDAWDALNELEKLTALTVEDTRSPELETIPIREDNTRAA